MRAVYRERWFLFFNTHLNIFILLENTMRLAPLDSKPYGTVNIQQGKHLTGPALWQRSRSQI